MAGNNEHINITLFFQQQSDEKVDLRIPRNISVYHLLKEIYSIFNRIDKNKKYQIKICNKGILLDEAKKIKDYPVTTGDLIEVLEDVQE